MNMARPVGVHGGAPETEAAARRPCAKLRCRLIASGPMPLDPGPLCAIACRSAQWLAQGIASSAHVPFRWESMTNTKNHRGRPVQSATLKTRRPHLFAGEGRGLWGAFPHRTKGPYPHHPARPPTTQTTTCQGPKAWNVVVTCQMVL